MAAEHGNEAAAPMIAFLRAAIHDRAASVDAYALALIEEGITVEGLEGYDDNELVRGSHAPTLWQPL